MQDQPAPGGGTSDIERYDHSPARRDSVKTTGDVSEFTVTLTPEIIELLETRATTDRQKLDVVAFMQEAWKEAKKQPALDLEPEFCGYCLNSGCIRWAGIIKRGTHPKNPRSVVYCFSSRNHPETGEIEFDGYVGCPQCEHTPNIDMLRQPAEEGG